MHLLVAARIVGFACCSWWDRDFVGVGLKETFWITYNRLSLMRSLARALTDSLTHPLMHTCVSGGIQSSMLQAEQVDLSPDGCPTAIFMQVRLKQEEMLNALPAQRPTEEPPATSDFAWPHFGKSAS